MVICPKCGRVIDSAIQKIVGPHLGLGHLGLYCPYCGRWLKWQKQYKSSFSQLPDDIVNNLPDDIVNNLPDDIAGDDDTPPWEV